MRLLVERPSNIRGGIDPPHLTPREGGMSPGMLLVGVLVVALIGGCSLNSEADSLSQGNESVTPRAIPMNIADSCFATVAYWTDVEQRCG